MVFDMHPCGLHVYYPKKIDGQYGFVQTVAENMKLFMKRQIDGALQACHLYETLGYPSNADFESVLRAGGIGGCTDTVQDAEDVTPRNSLAACTRAAISMGPSGNLSGGHCFLALDTGK